VVDSINNTYACLRTFSTEEDALFCHFFFGYDGRASGVPNFEGYYDMRADPMAAQQRGQDHAQRNKGAPRAAAHAAHGVR
jgi:hypothetical protein